MLLDILDKHGRAKSYESYLSVAKVNSSDTRESPTRYGKVKSDSSVAKQSQRWEFLKERF